MPSCIYNSMYRAPQHTQSHSVEYIHINKPPALTLWKNFKWKLLWETKSHADNETTGMTTATIMKMPKISPAWPLCPGCNASGHELDQPDFSWDTMTFMCQHLWGANTAMPLGFLSSLPKCTFPIRKTIQLNCFLWERSLDLCIYW